MWTWLLMCTELSIQYTYPLQYIQCNVLSHRSLPDLCVVSLLDLLWLLVNLPRLVLLQSLIYSFQSQHANFNELQMNLSRRTNTKEKVSLVLEVNYSVWSRTSTYDHTEALSCTPDSSQLVTVPLPRWEIGIKTKQETIYVTQWLYIMPAKLKKNTLYFLEIYPHLVNYPHLVKVIEV